MDVKSWIIAVSFAAAYLFVSLLSGRWEMTWIIWVVYCAYRLLGDRLARS